MTILVAHHYGLIMALVLLVIVILEFYPIISKCGVKKKLLNVLMI